MKTQATAEPRISDQKSKQIIRGQEVSTLQFHGLAIKDYTAGADTSSSFAVVQVPPGEKHRRAFSKRSDKYYYVVTGSVVFTLGDQEQTLSTGDFCLIRKGEQYSYQNNSNDTAVLCHVHTPSFDLDSEVFL